MKEDLHKKALRIRDNGQLKEEKRLANPSSYLTVFQVT